MPRTPSRVPGAASVLPVAGGAGGAGGRLPAEDGGLLSGPWHAGFWLCLRREVRSKANHRRGADRRAAKSVWSQNAGFELEVRNAARQYRPAGWLESDPDVPVAARPQLLVCVFARTRLDVGNIDKSLLDALQGPLMVSDAQVRWSLCGGQRASTDPGLVAGIVQLPAGTGLAEQAAAAQALVGQVAALVDPGQRPDPLPDGDSGSEGDGGSDA